MFPMQHLPWIALMSTLPMQPSIQSTPHQSKPLLLLERKLLMGIWQGRLSEVFCAAVGIHYFIISSTPPWLFIAHQKAEKGYTPLTKGYREHTYRVVLFVVPIAPAAPCSLGKGYVAVCCLSWNYVVLSCIWICKNNINCIQHIKWYLIYIKHISLNRRTLNNQL